MDNELVVILKNYKFGFANKKGEEVIPCNYDYVHSFIGGIAFVKKNGKFFLYKKE